MRWIFMISALSVVGLASCKEDRATPPPPVAMTEEALGVFCQMSMVEHPGPKAQIHLKDQQAPLFFSQVRDAIAYERMPEQDGVVVAVYVSDMGAAPSWEKPGENNWIVAETAYYVIGASISGGMGAPELVPFSDPDAAADFVAIHGGEIARLDEIGDEQVLAPVEFEMDSEGKFIPSTDATNVERTN